MGHWEAIFTTAYHDHQAIDELPTQTILVGDATTPHQMSVCILRGVSWLVLAGEGTDGGSFLGLSHAV